MSTTPTAADVAEYTVRFQGGPALAGNAASVLDAWIAKHPNAEPLARIAIALRRARVTTAKATQEAIPIRKRARILAREVLRLHEIPGPVILTSLAIAQGVLDEVPEASEQEVAAEHYDAQAARVILQGWSPGRTVRATQMPQSARELHDCIHRPHHEKCRCNDCIGARHSGFPSEPILYAASTCPCGGKLIGGVCEHAETTHRDALARKLADEAEADINDMFERIAADQAHDAERRDRYSELGARKLAEREDTIPLPVTMIENIRTLLAQRPSTYAGLLHEQLGTLLAQRDAAQREAVA